MEDREQGMNKGAGIDELVNEAEQRFREGVKAAGEWGAQAREIIQRQPGAVLAGVAILGFVTGLLIRRTASKERRS
jgi:hypothetical protein